MAQVGVLVGVLLDLLEENNNFYQNKLVKVNKPQRLTIVVVGFPAPWPALVSILIKNGFSFEEKVIKNYLTA